MKDSGDIFITAAIVAICVLICCIVALFVLAVVDPHAYELLNGSTSTSVTIKTGGK